MEVLALFSMDETREASNLSHLNGPESKNFGRLWFGKENKFIKNIVTKRDEKR